MLKLQSQVRYDYDRDVLYKVMAQNSSNSLGGKGFLPSFS